MSGQKKQESPEILMTLLRYLADSNRRRRFCRPLPSHSAKVPLWFASAKVALIFGLTNLYRPFFCSFLSHYPFSSVFQPHNHTFQHYIADKKFQSTYHIEPHLFLRGRNNAQDIVLSNIDILQISDQQKNAETYHPRFKTNITP